MRTRGAICLFILFSAGLIFCLPDLIPGSAPFLRDLGNEIIPKRTFWADSSGLALWDAYGFFGHPYAANPQSEAFYFLNWLFLVFPAPQALGWYIFLHWLIFLLFSYLSFRELDFDQEVSLAMSLALGFGGFFSSLGLLIVLLSTVTWTAVELYLLLKSLKGRWLVNSLLGGLVFAAQITAGEIEMALLGWLIIIAIILIHRPGQEKIWKTIGAILIAGFFGIILSAPQWLLTGEMIGLSNRASGIVREQAEVWSLVPPRVKEFFLASYLIPAKGTELWGLGFFNGFHYLLSIYLGMGVVLLSVLGLRFGKTRAWLWLLFSLFGIGIALGEYAGIYGWLHRFLPGFAWFRIPEKFIILPGFGIVILAGIGLKEIFHRQNSRILSGSVFLGIGVILAVILMAFPLKLGQLGNRYDDIQKYFLYRSLFRSLACVSVLSGLIFFKPWLRFPGLKLLPALIIFVDLWLAHRFLNPAISVSAYQAPPSVHLLLAGKRDRLYPIRIYTEPIPREKGQLQAMMNPVNYFLRYREALAPFWAMYFRLNDVRAHSSFYLADQDLYQKVLSESRGWSLTMARSGVEYYFQSSGDFFPFARPEPRASIYYQAGRGLTREEILRVWSDPNFAVDQAVLLEGKTNNPSSDQSLLWREPARIVLCRNHLVEIEAEAKRDGYLVLLDTYYPGWKAERDGRETEILRANGFFRAVKIPAGKHLITFKYQPRLFLEGLIISGIGLILWIFLFSFSLKTGKTGQ